MSTQGIGLLYLETHDWEQGVAFWQDLGFKLEFETDHRSGVLVAENGTRVFLAEQSLDDPLGADIYLAVANPQSVCRRLLRRSCVSSRPRIGGLRS